LITFSRRPANGVRVRDPGSCKELNHENDLDIKPVIFADGFENGDTSLWGSVTP
jgi:hypothetical protein